MIFALQLTRKIAEDIIRCVIYIYQSCGVYCRSFSARFIIEQKPGVGGICHSDSRMHRWKQRQVVAVAG